MEDKINFEVIIIGGSYAGLSAAMALGRSLREVLVIDSGKPCNRRTQHSHNFLTQDGKTPEEISSISKSQVQQYPTVQFWNGLAADVVKTANGFEVSTTSGESFTGKKLIFATGLNDIMPEIDGFEACWAKSILHCPYCHGYEVRMQKTGIFGNGEMGFEMAKMISNWTSNLVLLTDGPSTLTSEQTELLKKQNIPIIETEIGHFKHDDGQIQEVLFKDNTKVEVNAIYARIQFSQHCDIPESLGCELTEQGLISVDAFQGTTTAGVWACGDNSGMRSVSSAVYTGSMSGASVNKELTNETFVYNAV